MQSCVKVLTVHRLLPFGVLLSGRRMASGLSNPCQVQCYTGGKNAVPLVLIHDATGSIFSYFLLGDLDRDVWAIFDPKHDNGLCWDGGIPEMAQQYIGLLQATGITGPVLLGGKFPSPCETVWYT